MISRFIVIVFLCIVSIALPGQDMQSDLEKYYSTLQKYGLFNGSVLVADHGIIVYKKNAGFADMQAKRNIEFNTRFPIASISKTITATAILQLAETGKVDIASPVTNYLPQFPYPKVTLENLLSHTSGLPPYNAFFDSIRTQHPDTTFTNADFIYGIVHNPKPLLYEPGSTGNYDNINFIILALVIEEVTGMQYSEYIADHILRPTGMTQSLYLPLKCQYTQPLDFPFAYSYLYPHRYSDNVVKAGEVPYIVSYWSSNNFSGFGDYVSTISDLLKYDEAYYNGSLLKPETIDQAFEPVKLNDGRSNPANFGWGWQVGKDSSFGTVVFHNGNATGLSCILLRNVSKHQTIIIFDNIHSNNSQDLAFETLKILNGVKVPPPRKSIAAEYARVLVSKGPKAARKRLLKVMPDTLNYQLSEDEMNLIGYDFMGGSNNPNPYKFREEHKYKEALEIFRINVDLFPGSWNAYDSYGEILLKVGDREKAIKMYQKSLDLNPNNTGGRKVLEQLLK